MREEIYPITQTSINRKLVNFQICGITHPNKSYEIIRKPSDITCIEFVECGCGTIHFDDKTFYLSENDTYFLQAGHNQHYYSDTNEPWKKYFLNISGTLSDHLISGYNLENHTYFHGLSIKSELCRIIELAKQTDTDYTTEYIAILNEIFYKMRQFIEKQSNISNLANDMKDFLNTKITEPFCIEDLCKFSLKSESQTNRIFKTAFGITPYAYLLNKRISMSKKMLKGSSLPLKEIARRLQFADEYYFSNVFKKKTGFSPIEYKKIDKAQKNQA